MNLAKRNLNIGLIGYGKMGKTIEKIALTHNHEIILRISSSNTLKLSESHLNQLDVAIEFSDPTAAIENLTLLAQNKIPTVCGTTGWLDAYEDIIELYKSNKAPFLYASNFSIGVNVFFEVNKVLANLMNGLKAYDVNIHESHHTEKKDAPSGTAITLGEQIIESLDRKSEWSSDKDSGAESLRISSAREENVKGYHEIIYTSSIDDIKISHEAHSREGFARGALMAAEWIIGKEGIFSFKDIMADIKE